MVDLMSDMMEQGETSMSAGMEPSALEFLNHLLELLIQAIFPKNGAVDLSAFNALRAGGAFVDSVYERSMAAVAEKLRDPVTITISDITRRIRMSVSGSKKSDIKITNQVAAYTSQFLIDMSRALIQAVEDALGPDSNEKRVTLEALKMAVQNASLRSDWLNKAVMGDKAFKPTKKAMCLSDPSKKWVRRKGRKGYCRSKSTSPSNRATKKSCSEQGKRYVRRSSRSKAHCSKIPSK